MQNSETQISALTPESIPEIFPLAERFHQEFGYRGTFDREAFFNHWEAQILNGDGTVLVAEVDEKIVGTIGYSQTIDQFNGWPTTLVSFWYVDRELRRGLLGARLLHIMEEHQRDCGSKRILIGHPNSSQYTLHHAGFESIETGYEKVI